MSAIEILGISKDDLDVLNKKYSVTQDQTKEIFGFKWHQTESFGSEAFDVMTRDWLIEMYCNGDASNIDQLLGENGKIVLDAGCGVGYSASLLFGKRLKDHHYLGVDISNSIEVGIQRFKDLDIPADFIQCSLNEIPINDNSVDIIFSQGVLHHTDDTKASIRDLAKKLKPGGLFLFYVYKKKAAIREFSDDHIRNMIKDMDDEQAWKALESLTKLGISLGKINADIEIEEDIPYLGIKKGKFNLQRFFYYNIAKCYYREDFTFDEMNHINFDWYRPLNCHRHTPEEIKEWCNELNLEINNFFVDESGIAVVAKKK